MTTLSPEARDRILAGDSWLYHWLEAAGITGEELAEKTGIPYARIGVFMMEDDGPSSEEKERIAEALGTTVEGIESVQD